MPWNKYNQLAKRIIQNRSNLPIPPSFSYAGESFLRLSEFPRWEFTPIGPVFPLVIETDQFCPILQDIKSGHSTLPRDTYFPAQIQGISVSFIHILFFVQLCWNERWSDAWWNDDDDSGVKFLWPFPNAESSEGSKDRSPFYKDIVLWQNLPICLKDETHKSGPIFSFKNRR